MKLPGVRIGNMGACQGRRLDDGPGLSGMDVLQPIRAGSFIPFGFQIRCLTRHHAAHPCAPRHGAHRFQIPWVVPMEGQGAKHHLKGIGQQSIPCQHGHPFSKHLMVGGLAPAKIVVIHGGQIVMDQGIGMDHLQGAGNRQGILHIPAQHLAYRQGQAGPKPLSPIV